MKCGSCKRPCHADCAELWVQASPNCPYCGNVLRSNNACSSSSSSSFANRNFTVNVQDTKGDPRQISVNPNNTILSLKEDVRRSFNLASYAVIRLIYDGCPLSDRQKIGDCLQSQASIIMTANAQGASIASLQRLMYEYKNITDTNPPNISIQKPKGGDLYHWKGVMVGPSKSAWAGGVFPLKIIFPTNYPTTAPEVYFENMFHPNVYYPSGKVCITILAGDYNSTFSITSILTAIQSMLLVPNLNSVANTDAGNMFANDVVKYHKKVRQLVESSA